MKCKRLFKMINYPIKQRWIVFILFLLPFIFFSPVLLSSGELGFGDGVGYEMQFEYIKQAISNGELPFWNTYVAAGTSFVGDIQNKVFYPLTYICLFFPTDIAFKVFFVLHLSLCMIFVYIFLNELGCMRGTSFFGAVFVTFSNLIVLRASHLNIMLNIVWIWLILYFLFKTLKNDSWKYPIYMGLAAGMQFLAGFPQISLYTDIFLAGLYLWFQIKSGKSWKNWFVKGLLFLSVYIGIIAIQAIPLLELMRFSGRENISYEYFSEYGFEIKQLLNLFSPLFWGISSSVLGRTDLEYPTDTYVGVLPLILLVYTLFTYLKKDKVIQGFFAVGGIALLFSCACENIPWLGKVIYSIPLLGSFRTTTRMMCFFEVSVFVIAVLGLDKAVKSRQYKRLFTCSIFVTGIFCALVVVMYLGARMGIWSEEGNEHYQTSYFAVSLGLFIVSALLLAIPFRASNFHKYGQRIWVIILTIFVFLDVNFINVDPGANNFRIQGVLQANSYEETYYSPVAQFLENQSDYTDYRYFISYDTWEELAESSWGIRPNGNIKNKLSTIQSYLTFNNQMLLRLCNADYGMMMNIDSVLLEENPSLLSMLNVKYIIQRKERTNPFSHDKQIVFEQYSPIVWDKEKYITEISINNDDQMAVDRIYIVNIDIYINQCQPSTEIFIKDDTGNILFSQPIEEGQNYIQASISSQDIQGEELIITADFGTIAQINGVRIERKDDSEDYLLYSDQEYEVYENPYAMPAIYVPQNVQGIDNVEEYVIENESEIDFCTDAYVEGIDSVNLLGISASDVEISNIEKNFNSLIAQATVKNGSSFLCLSETYYPGWNAYVDGEKVKLYKVNGLIQGIEVPEGQHTIVFRYEPKSVLCGSIITFSTIIILGIYQMRQVKKRRSVYGKK